MFCLNFRLLEIKTIRTKQHMNEITYNLDGMQFNGCHYVKYRKNSFIKKSLTNEIMNL